MEKREDEFFPVRRDLAYGRIVQPQITADEQDLCDTEDEGKPSKIFHPEDPGHKDGVGSLQDEPPLPALPIERSRIDRYHGLPLQHNSLPLLGKSLCSALMGGSHGQTPNRFQNWPSESILSLVLDRTPIASDRSDFHAPARSRHRSDPNNSKCPGRRECAEDLLVLEVTLGVEPRVSIDELQPVLSRIQYVISSLESSVLWNVPEAQTTPVSFEACCFSQTSTGRGRKGVAPPRRFQGKPTG